MITLKKILLGGLAFFIFNACNTKESDNQNGTDENVYAKFDMFFKEYLEKHPMLATKLNKKANNGKWDDFSDDAALQETEWLSKKLKELKDIPQNGLSEKAKLSIEIFENYVKSREEGKKFVYHDYPINQYEGMHTQLPSFLIHHHQITDETDAKAYIERIKGFSIAMDQIIKKMELREEKGIIPPKFVFPAVKESCNSLMLGQPFDESGPDSELLKDFKSKIGKVLGMEDAQKQALTEAAKDAMLNDMKPAYMRLMNYWAALWFKSNDNDGVWKLPHGDEFYEYALRKHTTTQLTPDQISEMGENEVKLIHFEISELMKSLKMEKGSINDFFNEMKSNKNFFYSNDEAGRSAYLIRSVDAIEAIKPKMAELFRTMPKAGLEVKQVEGFRQKTAGLSFSEPGSVDGKQPGIYYINLFDMSHIPKYYLESSAYHEGLPGHHLQNSIALEYAKMPDMLTHIVGFEAYKEGWGLYAEFLPVQVGLYSDPYSDFGRLSLELWRAARMVVDVGIHNKGWSRKQAIDYMVKNTPSPLGEIEKDVERYIVIPGQAVSYKVGMDKIIELREKSSKELGDKFDIRDFHDVLLLNGPMPLDLLEKQVDKWILSKKSA